MSVVNNEMRPASLDEGRLGVGVAERSVRSEFDKKLNTALLSNIDVRDQARRAALLFTLPDLPAS